MSVTYTTSRTASPSVAPSDCATSRMLRKAWRIRGSSPSTSALLCGSMPRMPATKMKSPARVPTLQVPVGRMPPVGDRTFTPFGDVSARRGPRRRRAGPQPQRVQDAAHLALERRVDKLVLLDARLPAKARRDHGRSIVIPITGEVADRHIGIGNARLDQAFDLAGVHRHAGLLVSVRAGHVGRQPALEALPELRHHNGPLGAERPRVAAGRAERADRYAGRLGVRRDLGSPASRNRDDVAGLFLAEPERM